MSACGSEPGLSLPRSLTVVAITFRNAPAWVGARETSSTVAEPPLGSFPITQRAVAPAIVQLPLLATAEKGGAGRSRATIGAASGSAHQTRRHRRLGELTLADVPEGHRVGDERLPGRGGRRNIEGRVRHAHAELPTLGVDGRVLGGGAPAPPSPAQSRPPATNAAEVRARRRRVIV